jgi:hypothetical protein
LIQTADLVVGRSLLVRFLCLFQCPLDVDLVYDPVPAIDLIGLVATDLRGYSLRYLAGLVHVAHGRALEIMEEQTGNVGLRARIRPRIAKSTMPVWS